tara:strand:+ start:1710 stop:1832 length:123 start_codon:yes stop_codon:yes gene_type:complete
MEDIIEILVETFNSKKSKKILAWLGFTIFLALILVFFLNS